MREPNNSHFLFCQGNTYYFSVDIPPRSNQTPLSYDGYECRVIGDGQIGELEFVLREGRIGIFVLDKADDYKNEYLYRADTFPFIYDEVWMPSYTEENDVYLAVRIGTKWGVIRLFDDKNYHVTFKGWCVPWQYATRQEAIKAIRAKYNTSRLSWINAIGEQEEFE